MHRKDLARSLTLTTATAIVVGSIIGSGIFKKTAAMSDALPSPVLVLALWVVAGGISFLGALSAAELTATFPEAGGLYAHLRRILGRFVGFLYGWSTLAVIQTGSIASVSYVFAEYLRFFVPWADVPPAWAAWGVTLFGTIDLYPLRDLFTKLVAVACVLVVTGMNVRGVRLGGAVQNVFMAIKFLIMAGIVAVAAFGASRLIANLSMPVVPLELAPPSLGGSGSWMALAGAVTIALSGAFWAYDAWINVTYVAAEIKAPARNVPRALALGLGAVLVCYLAVNLAYFHLLDLDVVRGSTLVAADALGTVLPAAAGLVAFAVVLSTFGAANGMALSSARVPFAMARDGLLPRALGDVHPRRGTPANALWVQGGLVRRPGVLGYLRPGHGHADLRVLGLLRAAGGGRDCGPRPVPGRGASLQGPGLSVGAGGLRLVLGRLRGPVGDREHAQRVAGHGPGGGGHPGVGVVSPAGERDQVVARDGSVFPER